MLVLVSFVLAIAGLNATTYTCPNGQTYDDTTVTFCSNVVHTSSCTLELGGACEVSAEEADTSICCFDESNVIGTGEPTDTTDAVATDAVATDDPDTTVVSSSCDDALRTCYDGCCDRHNNDDDDESESERRQLLWGHGNHHEGHECRQQCESTWEACSGQSFSSELVDMDDYHGHGHGHGSSEGTSEGTSSDNDSSSNNGYHGHHGHSGSHSHSHDGNSHHHGGRYSSSSSSEENEDAYAGGSRVLSFFVIPLFIMICISLCCCCFCKRVKKRQTRDVRTMSSIVSMQKTKNGHIRVPSNEVPINTTSAVGEGTFVTV